VSIGNSKRGGLQKVFAAIDDRVIGVIQGGAPSANFSGLVDVATRTETAAFMKDADHIAHARGSEGWNAHESTFSVTRWAPSVLRRLFDAGAGLGFTNALGMIDQHANAAACTFTFADAANLRWLSVANYGHGMGSLDYAVKFRELVMLAAANASSSALLGCDASWDWSTNQVTAQVSDPAAAAATPTPTAPPLVGLWCVTAIQRNKAVMEFQPPLCDKAPVPPADDSDFRQRRWSRVAMATATPIVSPGSDATYTFAAAVPAAALRLNFAACYVRVQTGDGRVATSAPLFGKRFCEKAGFVVDKN
jgi:hypothetical protein